MKYTIYYAKRVEVPINVEADTLEEAYEKAAHLIYDNCDVESEDWDVQGARIHDKEQP